MISSKESAKESNAPAIKALRIIGKVTNLKVVNLLAPRSMLASAKFPPNRRYRAATLLKTTTIQKVACPITMVKKVNLPKKLVKTLFNAIPVTIPGNAIGSTKSKEMVSRPKNL